jgi:hypothetical protein
MLAAHATAVPVQERFLILLRDLGDEALGGQQQAAMEAAFCSAVRVTFLGSTTPALTRSSYPPVATL